MAETVRERPGAGEKRAETPCVSKPGQRLVAIVSCTVAAMPIIGMACLLWICGVDVVSNDYLAYAGLIGSILDGSYDWSGFLSDTLYSGHTAVIPCLVHLATAQLFAASLYGELYLGICLATLRLILAQQALTHQRIGWQKWALAPLLSFLIFSYSQTSVYSYPDATVPIGFCFLGITLSLWALSSVSNRNLVVVLAVAGGVLASYSWASGLTSWPVILLGMILLGYRKPQHYLAWLAGLVICLYPYASTFLLPGSRAIAPNDPYFHFQGAFRPQFILNSLGWPFANGIAFNTERLPMAEQAGWLGLILGVVGIFLALPVLRTQRYGSIIASVLFMAQGLAGLWQISLVRQLIAPWYTAIAMNYWIGLAALAAAMLWTSQQSSDHDRSPGRRTLTRLWAIGTLGIIFVLYLRSNLTYSDKTDYFRFRAPASAEVLRHYRVAPTYADSLVMHGGAGNPGLLQALAWPLERHRLSVFGLRQRWSMQGQVVLDRVTFKHGDTMSFWTESTSLRDRRRWDSYKRLNLFLPAGNEVIWKVQIPANAQSAIFKSACAVSESAPIIANPKRGRFIVSIRSTPHRGEREATNYQTEVPQPRVRSPGATKVARYPGQNLLPGQKDGMYSCRVTATGGRPVAAIREVRHLSFNHEVTDRNTNWSDFKLPLDGFRGQEVTIHLESIGNRDSYTKWLLCRYPHIDVDFKPHRKGSRPAYRRPVNTETSGTLPDRSPADRLFEFSQLRQWQVTGLCATPGISGTLNLVRTSTANEIAYKQELNEPLKQYTHMIITLCAPAELQSRIIEVALCTGDGNCHRLAIPLLPDSNPHAYSFNLQLLELEPHLRLTGLSVQPFSGEFNPDRPSQKLWLGEIRLVRRVDTL